MTAQKYVQNIMRLGCILAMSHLVSYQQCRIVPVTPKRSNNARKLEDWSYVA